MFINLSIEFKKFLELDLGFNKARNSSGSTLEIKQVVVKIDDELKQAP